MNALLNEIGSKLKVGVRLKSFVKNWVFFSHADTDSEWINQNFTWTFEAVLLFTWSERERRGGRRGEGGRKWEGGRRERKNVKHVHRVHSCREGDISSHSSLYTIVPTKIIFYKMGSSYKSKKSRNILLVRVVHYTIPYKETGLGVRLDDRITQ